MKNYLLAVIVGCFLISSCANNHPTNKVSLRFDWTTNMSFCGDVYGMYEFGKKNNIEINCVQAGEGIDPIKMVASGTDNFGIVSYEKLLAANEKGADMIVLGFINPVSPTVFVAKEGKKFNEPKDFEGKSVGIMPGGATELVYRAFVKKTKVDQSKIKEVPASFDVQGFINNQYDVKLSFIYVENVALDEHGVKYNMIEPRNFGVFFPGRVYFAKRNFVEKNKELTQRFINSIIEGWKASFADPKKSIALLKKYDKSIDIDRELKSLEKGRPYFEGHNNQFLMVDESKLNGMVELLKDVDLIKDTNYKASLDLSFVKSYYANNPAN